jgi:t-SNARE syntaxin family protein
LISARQELSDNLSSLADDLADLAAAVKAVEGDPYKYGLDVSDVAARRRFVEEAMGDVEDMKEEMESAETPPPTHPQYGGFVGDDDEDEVPQDQLVAYEREQQVQMMREQDLQLEGVYRSVGTLRAVANTMGQELSEQAELVDALDRDVDRVQGKLGKGLKDLNTFIRKNEGKLHIRSVPKPFGYLGVDGCFRRYGKQLVHRSPDTGPVYSAFLPHYTVVLWRTGVD